MVVGMRVCVFGIDGLTFRLLDPLMERGLLPHFQQVRTGGVRGIVRSTTPPVTPPAWMSLATGLAPAQHGVYDFWEYEDDRTDSHSLLVTHRKGGKAIWNMLSELGKRVIVANVPLTYPPEPVNGIMLSGYMAPGIQANITYPIEYKQELLQFVPDYQIDLHPLVAGGKTGNLLTEILKMTQARVAMMRHLMNSNPWDFFFIVFTGADRIQHLCWDKIVAEDPEAIAYYQVLDEALGMALASLAPDDLLMIVSDHGFQRVNRVFAIQEYLWQQGFLHVRDEATHHQGVMRTMFVDAMRSIIWKIGLQGFPTRIRRQWRQMQYGKTTPVPVEHRHITLPDLDWGRTRAWLQSPSGDMAGYADIFLSETLSEGEIRQLEEALLAIQDPKTGEKLLTNIYREDALGDGPFAPLERHLILLAGEGMTLRAELGSQTLWKTVVPYGVHHPDGVLYLYGAHTRQGVEIAPVSVYDVVPTILACMGGSSSEELVGKVIEEAFLQPSLDVILRKAKVA